MMENTFNQSVPRLEKYSRIKSVSRLLLIIIVSLVLGWWVARIINATGIAIDQGSFLLLHIIGIISSIFIFHFLYPRSKTKPRIVHIMIAILILMPFDIYYYYGVGDKMYASHMEPNFEPKKLGHGIDLVVVPDNPTDLFRRKFDIPIRIEAPSGKIIEANIEIIPFYNDGCRVGFWGYKPCYVSEHTEYQLGVFDEIGTYKISSENPSVKGLTIDVMPR